MKHLFKPYHKDHWLVEIETNTKKRAWSLPGKKCRCCTTNKLKSALNWVKRIQNNI